MMKVFVGGSRFTTKLNAEVLKRLDNMMEKNFPVIVGDANGADKAVQQYLHGKGYQNVEIFCSGRVCRNNIGKWRTRNIAAGAGEKGAQFYSVKDRAMADEATIGLMIWDQESIGTLLNVYRLIARNKKIVVYLVPEKRFVELRNASDLDSLMNGIDDVLRAKFSGRAKLEESISALLMQSSFFDSDRTGKFANQHR